MISLRRIQTAGDLFSLITDIDRICSHRGEKRLFDRFLPSNPPAIKSSGGMSFKVFRGNEL